MVAVHHLRHIQRKALQTILIPCREFLALSGPDIKPAKLMAQNGRLDSIHTVVVSHFIMDVALTLPVVASLRRSVPSPFATTRPASPAAPRFLPG